MKDLYLSSHYDKETKSYLEEMNEDVRKHVFAIRLGIEWYIT